MKSNSSASPSAVSTPRRVMGSAAFWAERAAVSPKDCASAMLMRPLITSCMGVSEPAAVAAVMRLLNSSTMARMTLTLRGRPGLP